MAHNLWARSHYLPPDRLSFPEIIFKKNYDWLILFQADVNVCPRSLAAFYITIYYIKWVKTFWTYINTQNTFFCLFDCIFVCLYVSLFHIYFAPMVSFPCSNIPMVLTLDGHLEQVAHEWRTIPFFGSFLASFVAGLYSGQTFDSSSQTPGQE